VTETRSELTGHRFVPSQCAAPGCRVKVRAEMLACRDHWFALPSDLRVTINAAYRAKDKVSYRLAIVEAIQEWRPA
jgi:hypothetical protein